LEVHTAPVIAVGARLGDAILRIQDALVPMRSGPLHDIGSGRVPLGFGRDIAEALPIYLLAIHKIGDMPLAFQVRACILELTYQIDLLTG
jgi:hypothetical protein